MTDRPENLYLDLLKRCLTRTLFDFEHGPLPARRGLARIAFKLARQQQPELGRAEVPRPVDHLARAEGRDWPASAETMIGLKRLDQLQDCIVDVLQKRIPGDLIEAGVWRGGAAILMRAVLEAFQDKDRAVWVADSFGGLPKPDPGRYPEDLGDQHWTHRELAVSESEVRANFERYGLLDRRVHFLKGWFSDTLAGAPIDQLAVLRIDGDMYQSTIEALEALYPRVSQGGYVIVDDAGALPNCRQAVLDFRARNAIEDTIHEIDWAGIYWVRNDQSSNVTAVPHAT